MRHASFQSQVISLAKKQVALCGQFCYLILKNNFVALSQVMHLAKDSRSLNCGQLSFMLKFTSLLNIKLQIICFYYIPFISWPCIARLFFFFISYTVASCGQFCYLILKKILWSQFMHFCEYKNDIK